MKNMSVLVAGGFALACSSELGAIADYDHTTGGWTEEVPMEPTTDATIAWGSGGGTLVGDTPATTQQKDGTPPVAEDVGLPEGISFGADKWLNPEGTETATVGGRFTDYRVAFNRPVSSLDDLSGLEVTVTVALSSLDTGSLGRDVNILESYFESALFPTATAIFTHFEEASISAVDLPADLLGQSRAFVATMDLEMRGTTQRIDNVQLELTVVEGGYRVRTKSPIAIRTDLGMPVAALLLRCQHHGINLLAPTNVNLFIPQ